MSDTIRGSSSIQYISMYCFIIIVTSYIASVECEFTEIGPPFDPKGFGIGVPPGAVYLEELSMAILKLGDEGLISEFTNK